MPYIAPFPASQHFGAKGQLIRRIDMVAKPYPLGYTPTMVFTQPPVEAALRAHAAAYDSVEVELGTELIGFEQSPDHVTLHLRDDSGATRSVTADYVIACDGASSATRQAARHRLRGSRIRRALAGGRSAGQRCRARKAAARPRRNSAIRRGRPPSSSAPAITAASRSCCCRAKIRARWKRPIRSGGCSRAGSRLTTPHCGAPRATGFTRWSRGNGGAAASSSPAMPRISSRPSSARACARAFAMSAISSGSSTAFSRASPATALLDTYAEERASMFASSPPGSRRSVM